MKKIRFILRTKMMIFTFIIVVTSVVFISIFFTAWARNNLKDMIGSKNMNTAIIISNFPYFSEILESEDPEGIIQNFTYSQLSLIEDQDMIVVANMNGKRFAHPNIDRLGEYFVGGDERRVIETGESYISEATGTLGPSLRAFAPIINSEGKQIGFIMVGTMLEEIAAIQSEAVRDIIIYSFGGLLLGLIGAILFTNMIKKSLLGLEPDQISRLYTEKYSMLKAIQEGIISIDQNKNITMINDSAKDILKVSDTNTIGRKIYDIFPNSGLEEVLVTGVSEIEKERHVNGIDIVLSIVPINKKEEVIGVIASFRDKTEVTRLAEEITGYNEIVQALRSNSHEFLNKLHVILGLIQMGDIEQAKTYILGIKDSKEQITLSLMKKIKDPIIVGLILGKVSRANELGIVFDISIETHMKEYNDKNKTTAIVTILGNLIENAFDATAKDVKSEKKVFFTINNIDNITEFVVEDNGVGIEEKYLDKIYERGFSTNSGNRGIGLSLVKEKVSSLSGEIKVTSKINKGTTFKISIPKEDTYD